MVLLTRHSMPILRILTCIHMRVVIEYYRWHKYLEIDIVVSLNLCYYIKLLQLKSM